MMLAMRLERVAKETVCLQARLEEQAGALRACQGERMRLERTLSERDERLAALEIRLAEALAMPATPVAVLETPPVPAVAYEAEPEPPARATRPGGLLGRLKRGRKTDDVPAPFDEPIAETTIEPTPEPEEAPAPVPQIVARRFAPQEFLNRLPDLDDAQLDLLNFGVAQLGDDGAVIALNHRESACTGVSRADALNRRYFGEILAAADGKKLQQKLVQGAGKGKLDLPLLTSLDEGAETVRAIVHLFRHEASGTNWALVRRESDGK